jgi:hypothetical protein
MVDTLRAKRKHSRGEAEFLLRKPRRWDAHFSRAKKIDSPSRFCIRCREMAFGRKALGQDRRITNMDTQQTEMTQHQENGAVDESGNVDRIRQIIFGSQMRDYDSRFQKLEERLVREAGELRGDLQRQLQALETFMRGEAESMSNRLKAEQAERGHAVEQLTRGIAETARGLELRIGNLDNQAAQDIRDLRERLLEQSKALSNELKERHEQVTSHLERETGQIRDAMTGRESLAEMLSEVALRLKNEFRVPGAS